MQNAVEPLVHIYRDKNNLAAHRFLSVRVVEGQEQFIEGTIKTAFSQIASRRGYEQARLTDKVSAQYQLIEGILKTWVNAVAIRS